MSESRNLGQLRSEVEGYLLNTSTDANTLTWSVAEINGYINEAVLYSQQITSWFEEFDNLLCTASTSTYTASPRVHQFIRLTWDGVFLPQTNEYELDRDDPSWRLASPNNPFRFYFPALGQQTTLVPYPTPSQSGVTYAPFSQETGVVTSIQGVAAGTFDATFSQETGIIIGDSDANRSLSLFQVDVVNNPFQASQEYGEMVGYSTDELNIGEAYVRLPDTLILDTDTPQLPVQCHLGLVFYALMKCFVREGEFQDLEVAKGWFAAYGDWMEAVLENKARWYSTRVRSLEPYEEGSLFAQRLNAIGYPLQLDLKPSYGT